MTQTRSLQRFSAAICGLACLAGTALILRSIESRSVLVLTVVTALILAAVCLGGLALARASVWESLSAVTRRLLARQEPPLESRGLGIVLVLTGLAAYVIQLAVLFPLNDSFSGQDEEAYLITAGEIAAVGSTRVFLESLYSGEFAEANRHPLYLWLLSGMPSFSHGKFFSVVLGCWAMAMVMGVCVRRGSGWLCTGIVCLLLGLNSAWARFSVTIGCEVLLVGLVACLWFQFAGKPIQGTTDDIDANRSPDRRGPFLMAWFGVLAALFWLAKGTGLLLTASIALWLVIRRRKCVPPDVHSGHTRADWKVMARELLVFLAAWTAVASPLLVRNQVRYGSPLYNVNSWLLFADDYADPVVLSEASTIGAAARAYLANHSLAEILRRELSGLAWEVYILVRSLGPPGLEDARVLPGVVIAGLAVLGWCITRGEEKWLLLIWLIFSLLVFAWYVPVAAGERFVLPLLLPILLCASDGAVHLAGKVHAMRSGI